MASDRKVSHFEVSIDLHDIINAFGMDDFNDLIESALAADGTIKTTDVLEDIEYSILGKGNDDTGILIGVEAYVQRLDEEDDSEAKDGD